MGASGKVWLRLRMEEQHYQQLEHETREMMEITSIEPEFDYSFDEEWKEFNRDAGKAYKAKKEREHYLRKIAEDEN